jgi:hypothetical protein
MVDGDSKSYVCDQYSIPNGSFVPSPALARSGLVRCGPTLCGLMDYSCRAMSGVGPDWQHRPGPMASFSGHTGTVSKTARWAATQPSTNLGTSVPPPIVGLPWTDRRPRCSQHRCRDHVADLRAGDLKLGHPPPDQSSRGRAGALAPTATAGREGRRGNRVGASLHDIGGAGAWPP